MQDSEHVLQKMEQSEFIGCTLRFTACLVQNLFMLSVRISSYGCTREVWRARKMRKSCTRR